MAALSKTYLKYSMDLKVWNTGTVNQYHTDCIKIILSQNIEQLLVGLL